MSLCREVVTLQLGHYSNFVGTHWWNLQDASLCYDPDMPPGELQSDVLFREGLTRGGHVTYTPRLITLDLKGSLRTLKQEGSLYSTGQEPSTITWEGQIMTHKESPPAKNSFLQDLDKLDKGGLLVEPDFNTPSVPATHSPGGMVAMDTVNSNLERVHKFYKMEGSVMVWSDFLRLHLHPRTVSVINQYNHEGEAARLEAFSQGETLLQGSVLEDLEDRLHFFVEECDYLQVPLNSGRVYLAVAPPIKFSSNTPASATQQLLKPQGFQVLCDLADGFSGLGSKVTELLQDSYGGRGILTWGVAPVNHPDSSPIKELYHMMNFALGTVNLANHSSFFCPLTLRGSLGRRPSPSTVFPLVNYDSSLWYHSSSILALALDSMTVSYRLRYNSAPMWQLADALTVSGRKVVCAYGSVPFPIMQGTCLPDALSACGDVLPWKPLSACPELADGRCFGQSVTLKGLDRQRLVSPLAPGIQPSSTLHCARTGEEVLDTYIRSHYPSAPLVVQLVSTPSKLTPPFPQMFSSLLDPQGLIQRHPPTTAAGPAAVLAAPVLTSVQSSSAVGQMLAELQKACVSVEMRRSAPSFLCQGLEAGDLAENLEQLRVLAYHYRDDSGGTLRSSSEEEDDDDVD